MLLNSPEGIRYAQALAVRISGPEARLDLADVEPTNKLIDSLFQRTLCRSATPDERSLAGEFLKRHRDQHAKKAPADQAAILALTDLCRAVLNLNEFVYID